MAVSGGWITTVSSESWQSFHIVWICESIALTHTIVGRRDPYPAVVIFVPAVMPLSTLVMELGSAERKKAL